MERSWYRTRRHAGRGLALRGKKKKKTGERRSSVNGIVLDRRTFFLRPGPGLFPRSLPRFRSPRRPGRGLSGTTSTTTPNERPQKKSSNLSLPVAYYQSPRQSQIGSVGPVCAADPSVLLRFHISEPFSRTQIRDTRATRICKWDWVGQVDERRSHVPPRRGTKGGPPEESIPLRCGFLLSRRADSLLENSCRRLDRGFEGLTLPFERAKCGPIVKIHYAAHQPRVSCNASPPLCFFSNATLAHWQLIFLT